MEPLQLVGLMITVIVLLLVALGHAWALAAAIGIFGLIAAILFVVSARRERALISEFVLGTCGAGKAPPESDSG
jgi:hypothetical protein